METKSPHRKHRPEHLYQIDGGWTYTFTATNVSTGQQFPVAECVATPDRDVTIVLGSNTGYAAHASVECWYIDTANLQYLASASYNMVVSRAAIPTGSGSVSVSSIYSGDGSGSIPYFRANEGSQWSTTAPAVPTGATPSYYVWTDPSGGPSVWMRWDQTGSSGAYGLAEVVWYYMSSTAPSSPLSPAGTFVYSSSAPSPPYWTGIS